VILGRADGFAAKHALGPSMYDGFIMGVGFAAVLVVLGGLRELTGTGALFANMDLLFGPAAADWKIVVFPNYQPFLLAILPPGAFIFTGLIIAVKNLIDAQIKKREEALKAHAVKGSKRVRVTGAVS
jgi:electron transport complex protein RnfE